MIPQGRFFLFRAVNYLPCQISGTTHSTQHREFRYHRENADGLIAPGRNPGKQGGAYRICPPGYGEVRIYATKLACHKKIKRDSLCLGLTCSKGVLHH